GGALSTGVVIRAAFFGSAPVADNPSIIEKCRLVVTQIGFGMEGDQGEIKFFQRLVLFGNHQKVLANFGNEAGGSNLGPYVGAGFAHRAEVWELSARGAVRILPIDLPGTKSNPVNHNALWPGHNRSICLMRSEPG